MAIHTIEEKFLFTRLISELNLNGNRPNFETFVKKWNPHANGNTIFYKTVDQIEKYYKKWKDQEAAKNTRIIHQDTIESLQNSLLINQPPRPLLPALTPTVPSINTNFVFTPTVLSANGNNTYLTPSIPVTGNRIPSVPPSATIPFSNLFTDIFSTQQQQAYVQVPANAQYKKILPKANQPTLRPIVARPVLAQRTSTSHMFVPPPKGRNCKGCGANTCSGNRNRELCPDPKCFKCWRSQCSGLFDETKCDYQAFAF